MSREDEDANGFLLDTTYHMVESPLTCILSLVGVGIPCTACQAVCVAVWEVSGEFVMRVVSSG